MNNHWNYVAYAWCLLILGFMLHFYGDLIPWGYVSWVETGVFGVAVVVSLVGIRVWVSNVVTLLGKDEEEDDNGA